MEKIGLPKISQEEVGADHSRFVLEPLYPGYGATLGNALRRVMLSSIQGSAATYFRVDGIDHEFSAVPGAKEDMIQLLMNIKGIKFRSFSDEPVTLELNKKGPAVVTAGDIKANSQVEIANPDHKILELDKDGSLHLELIVEKDRGFRPAGLNSEKKEIGWIAIDAAFSPVNRVSLSVEATRVGQMTNFDKLSLDVVTDGTIQPKDALKEASRVLVDHFEAIIDDVDYKPELTARQEEAVVAPVIDEEEIDRDSGSDIKVKIEEAGFSPRTTNALINSGIKTIAGLKRLSTLKLEEIRGLGKKGISEVREVLNQYE